VRGSHRPKLRVLLPAAERRTSVSFCSISLESFRSDTSDTKCVKDEKKQNQKDKERKISHNLFVTRSYKIYDSYIDRICFMYVVLKLYTLHTQIRA